MTGREPSGARGVRRLGTRLGLLLAAIVGTLLVAEVYVRLVVAGRVPGPVQLRQAKRFTEYFHHDDHWILRMRLDPELHPPIPSHPLLGWVFKVDPATFVHHDFEQLDGRRPVLLYGDSFADCMPQVVCFEEQLAASPEFSAGHLLLNHGVGGYGTDQILLLLQNTIDLYEDPFVVLSLMTLDLDRSVLSFRSGPKPRFRLDDGELVLEPPKLVASRDEIPEPRIGSYLYRLLISSTRPATAWRSWLRADAAWTAKKIELNRVILDAALDELRARDLDFCVVVFEPHLVGLSETFGEPDWREEFLREFFGERGIDPIWSSELIPPPPAGEVFDAAPYFLPADGHPTTRLNQLVSDAIAERVLAVSESSQ